MSEGEKKVVCVTGGSGYIASWLVKMLLECGYTVRATLRSLNDPKKTEHLLALDGAKKRLHLFEADLTVEGAFDSVVDGCIGVFHTASPVTFTVTDPKAEVLDPAVKGTLNVLTSCAKAQSIKRVILTSSIAAVYLNGTELNSSVEIDETWFSDPKLCEELKLWYVLSKTLAEEAASKFAKEKGVDLVILNPSYVIGPLLQPTLNLTCEGILDLVNNTGKRSFYEGHAPYVDVRDVAYAHIQAFEIPSATGRYLLVGNVTYHTQVLNIIHNLYPTISLAQNDACIYEYQMPCFPPHKVSTKRAKSLGISSFIPLEVSLKDTIQSLKEKKLYSF